METKEKLTIKIFEFIFSIGSGNKISYDIIDMSDTEDDQHYRLYHSNGHCIDSYKKWNEEDRIYEYEYYSDLFEGFKPISVDDLIKLLKL